MSLLAVLAANEVPVGPVVIFMALGVVIAIFGHASKSNGLVLTGLMILFLATAGMFVGAFIAYQNDERDVRPPCGETVKVCEKDGESPSERP